MSGLELLQAVVVVAVVVGGLAGVGISLDFSLERGRLEKVWVVAAWQPVSLGPGTAEAGSV